jgi:hypothetical protein
MMLSAADLGARLNSPRNSERGKERKRAVRSDTVRTIEDLDRNDIPAGPALFIRDTTPGQRPGDKRLSEEVRIPATVLAKLGVSSKDMQETFGIGPQTVSNLKNEKGLSEEGKETVNSALEAIKGTLVSKLETSIGYLTDDKFANAKGKDLVGMMRGIAATVKDISPAEAVTQSNRVQVVIHSVNQKDVSHYDVIEVTS